MLDAARRTSQLLRHARAAAEEGDGGRVGGAAGRAGGEGAQCVDWGYTSFNLASTRTGPLDTCAYACRYLNAATWSPVRRAVPAWIVTGGACELLSALRRQRPVRAPFSPWGSAAAARVVGDGGAEACGCQRIYIGRAMLELLQAAGRREPQGEAWGSPRR
jgi:hypothetical protein